MIIWIDGTYGSGKTRISSEINKAINNSVLFSADYFYKNIWNSIIEKNPFLCFGDIGHANINFLEKFKEYLETNINEESINIIDICLLNDNGKRIIFDKLYSDKDKHIILDISYDSLIKRMEKDKRQDKQLPFAFYQGNTSYIKYYPDAFVIENNDDRIDKVVEMCLKYIFK